MRKGVTQTVKNRLKGLESQKQWRAAALVVAACSSPAFAVSSETRLVCEYGNKHFLNTYVLIITSGRSLSVTVNGDPAQVTENSAAKINFYKNSSLLDEKFSLDRTTLSLEKWLKPDPLYPAYNDLSDKDKEGLDDTTTCIKAEKQV